MPTNHASGATHPRRAVAGVSLDIWGTLLGSDPDFKAARNRLLRDALLPSVGAEQFDQVMRQADRDVDDECARTGADVGFVGRIVACLTRFGMPQSVALDAVSVACDDLMCQQEALALMHPPRPLHTELPAAVLELQVPVVLTSNTGMLPGALMRKLLALAGFGGVTGVFSDEVGVAKPAPAIFGETLAVLGLPPPDVLHVGDNPVADVAGAREAGLQTALVIPDGLSTLAVLRELS
ncbi:HAD family hydrolase [Rudaeicoccus suwonensis]|uniref:HAD superfamily hydrolase (TIGR01549 family) n=1 Tax=Rudaeicoccus suwonensis TaxID=657409 RepID=A0A561E498_9MICO|nr:HAD family hydrolase [Rudaeicoccus suwonensis]TWE10434.1 HAD superfamily hydrolase (TIGR01549 family) [Rudaeicoccus suwonensis]